MLLQIQQNELEAAVRDYVSKMGIARPVGEIKFTATRSGNAGILTEIEFADIAQVSIPSGPINRGTKNQYIPDDNKKEAPAANVKTAEAELKPVAKASVFATPDKPKDEPAPVVPDEPADKSAKPKLFS